MNFRNRIRKKINFSFCSRFYICAAVGNLLLCIINLIAVPSVIEFSKLHMAARKPAMAALILALAIIMGVFITLLGHFSQRHGTPLKNKDIKEHIKRMGMSMLVFMCFSFAWFLVCGLIASAVYLALRQSFSYARIKTVIDIMTTVLALLAMPVVLMQMLSFSLGSLPVKNMVKAGFERLSAGYFKMLCVVLIWTFAGALLAQMFSLPGGGSIQGVLEVLAFTALGSISTCVIYETGITVYAGGGRKWFGKT